MSPCPHCDQPPHVQRGPMASFTISCPEYDLGCPIADGLSKAEAIESWEFAVTCYQDDNESPAEGGS